MVRMNLHPLEVIWNENCGEMRSCRAMTAKRTKLANLRLKEEPDLEVWKEAVIRAASTMFCTGRNDHGWIANFDWFIREGKLVEILEGKFDDKPKARF